MHRRSKPACTQIRMAKHPGDPLDGGLFDRGVTDEDLHCSLDCTTGDRDTHLAEALVNVTYPIMQCSPHGQPLYPTAKCQVKS
jgi:hypothetical protein